MADIAKLEVQVSQSGAQQTGAALDGVAGSGRRAETSLAGLALKIAGYTTAATLATEITKKIISGFFDLSRESIVLAAGFEKAKITWGVLVGDMGRGTEVFKRLQDFAARTPLSFEGVESAAKTLKGFGIETEALIPTLSRLGDLSMGDSSALGRLALVFGQVQAQGKAMTQDLYQFVNSGVPIFNLLADSMQVSAGEIKSLAADGKIGFAEISDAIEKATSEGGKFYGLMDKTSETTAGKWSTTVDLFKTRLAELGETVLPLINSGLETLNRLLAGPPKTGLSQYQGQGDPLAQGLSPLDAFNGPGGPGGGRPPRKPPPPAFIPFQLATYGGELDEPSRGGEMDYESIVRLNDEYEKSIRIQSEWAETAQNAENITGSMAREVDTVADSIARMNESFAVGAIYEYADSMRMLGEFAADGSISFREMSSAIGSFALAITNMLPRLAIQAGLMLLTNANPADDAMGWWLLLGGGLGSMLAGYANEASKSANGNAFGGAGLMAFAAGGAFTNKIVNRPTLFAFAGGAGLMGEAGPEAIMPLKRSSSGRLGVEASGSGAVQLVEIHNYTGQQTRQERSEGPNGEQILRIVIGAVASGIASGTFDGAAGSRWGVKYAGVKR